MRRPDARPAPACPRCQGYRPPTLMARLAFNSRPGAQSWKSAQAGAVGYDLLKSLGARKILDPARGVEETAQTSGRPVCNARRSDREARARHRRHLARLAGKYEMGMPSLAPGGSKDHEQTSGVASAGEIGGVFAPCLSDVGGRSLPTLQQRRDRKRQVPVAFEQLAISSGVSWSSQTLTFIFARSKVF